MVAVVFRFLAGMLLAATAGSMLAVATVHASFNASGSLTAVDGKWQFVVALLLVTIIASIHWRRTLRGTPPEPTWPGGSKATPSVASSGH